jgi:hypothetical protein
MVELKESIGKRVSTYRLNNYKVKFTEEVAVSDIARDMCSIEMYEGKKPLWKFAYFHKNGIASFSDLINIGKTKEGTRRAAEQLDLMFHCMENYMHEKGITQISGRTNHKFARFLRRSRGYSLRKVNEVTRDVKKRVSKKKNPLPSIMNSASRIRRK